MRTAIIGLGRMGRRHLEVARGLGLDVVAIADSHAETVQAVGQEWDVAPAARYTDARAMLANAAATCVIVATTAPTHSEYTCLAAENGATHILCEKPLAVSLAECARMRDTCARHGAALAVNHPMRYMEQYTTPRALLDSPELGGLASVTVIGGNFGLAMNGAHYFEMFRYLTGEAPATVTAWLAADPVPNPRGAQFSDRAGQVRVTTASGKRLYLDAGHDQGHGLRVVYGARYGRIDVDELTGAMLISARQAEHRGLPTTRYAAPSSDREQRIAAADVLAATRAVLAALLDGRGYPDGRDGELAVAALVAAYVSDESGHAAVAVDAARLPQERSFPWA